MIRSIKKTLCLLLLCTLLLSLSGCNSLDYREAIGLYNDHRFDEAAAIFQELADYEDSANLLRRSRYLAAADRMAAGDYQDALDRFQTMTGYEDVDARILECQYQLAIRLFDAGDYAGAEAAFRSIHPYRQSQAYLRQISWQKLYDYICTAGSESGGCFLLSRQVEDSTVNVIADVTTPDQLSFTISSEFSQEYAYSDSLTLTLPRQEAHAAFVGTSTFHMPFGDGQIGSDQESAGTIPLSVCTPAALLTPSSFTITVTDHHGETTTSQDPADSRLQPAMQENLRILLDTVVQLMAEGCPHITLQDLGFAPFE